MKFRNSLDFINEFFLGFSQKIRKIYLSSNIYDKKISKVNQKSLSYRPSFNTLSCIVKYEKKKNKIENFEIENLWENNKLEYKEVKKLNNFFWLFSIDLKSSKKISTSILDNWIKKNQKYSKNTWEIDTLSKRIISWISNSKLIYDEADHTYKEKFNKICVVEDISDQWSIENSNIFDGYFHILGGTISSVGSKKEDLLINSLINRVKTEKIEEVILATSATVEGQTTAYYIKDSLKDIKVKVTKLAQGLPIGGEIENLDDGTLFSAFKNRSKLNSNSD